MIRPPRVVGRRGAVLAYLALVDVLFALSLVCPAPETAQSSSTRFLADLAPLPSWGALWFVVGVVCLVGAFVHRLDRYAFACAAGIKTLWGGVFLFGWLAGEIERGWVGAVLWLGLAVLVVILAGWPEPRET
jgi:hypothetical protein